MPTWNPSTLTDCATPAEIAAAVAAAVPDATDIQAAAEAAIGAETTTLAAAISGGGYATTYAMVFGDGSVTLGNVWRSCVTAIADKTADLTTAIVTTSGLAASIDAIPTAAENATAVAVYAAGGVPSAMLHASVTISGIGTSGTVLAAPGADLRYRIIAVTAACSSFNSTFSLASSGGTTMGTMQLLVGATFALSIPFGYVILGGSNAAITGNKSASAILEIDVWYCIEAG